MSRLQQGDTIIEVIIAVTVFSLVAVGGITLMNQGAAMAQRSLEIGLVRDQIDTQADILRYLHQAHIASLSQDVSVPANKLWQFIADRAVSSNATSVDVAIQKFESVGNAGQCQLPSNTQAAPFALNSKKLTASPSVDPTLSFNLTSNTNKQVPISEAPPTMTDDYSSTTYAQLQYKANEAISQGIWMQAYHYAATSTKAGYYDFYIRACWLTPGQTPPMTLGTVVRLYEPAA